MFVVVAPLSLIRVTVRRRAAVAAADSHSTNLYLKGTTMKIKSNVRGGRAILDPGDGIPPGRGCG